MAQKNKILLAGGGVVFLYIAIVVIIITTTESKAQSSTWTVQTLKEYVDQRFNAMQEAVGKAETSTEKRFEGVNEFRNTLSDQQKTFVSKSEYDAGHTSLQKDITELKERVNKMETLKVGGSNTLYIIIAIVSFFFAVFAFARNYLMPKK